MTKSVTTRIQDQIATLTIDRPPVNAMTRESYKEVRDAFQAMNRRDEVRVAVLTGAGRAFSAGIDMKAEFTDRDPNKLLAVLQMVEEAAEAIEQCRVPVIGAINGVALAGGFVLASACDILVASEKAQFGVPEVLVGITGGSERLRRLVPEHKARTLAITGQNVTAQQLYEWGAVEKVVSPENLMEEALALAKLVASRSPLAVQAVKRSQNYLEGLPNAADAARFNWALSRELFGTEDTAEAIEAFFAGRVPKFKGE
jgi:enoyl-CoA hydratase/carnithine racemase